MREPSHDSPVSAVFEGIVEGIVAAFTGVVGFIAAVVVGVVIGFASNGVTFTDTQDSLFAVYLFIMFPLGLLKHLLDASGFFTVLCMSVFVLLFLSWDRFKAGSLLGLCITIGLYTFQAIALTRENHSSPWGKFTGIVLGVIVVFVTAKSLLALASIWGTKRATDHGREVIPRPVPEDSGTGGAPLTPSPPEDSE